MVQRRIQQAKGVLELLSDRCWLQEEAGGDMAYMDACRHAGIDISIARLRFARSRKRFNMVEEQEMIAGVKVGLKVALTLQLITKEERYKDDGSGDGFAGELMWDARGGVELSPLHDVYMSSPMSVRMKTFDQGQSLLKKSRMKQIKYE